MLSFKRTLISVCACVVLCAAFAERIEAHPLGNFTINHYTRIETSPDRVRLRYVVDMAEIPALQALQGADAAHQGTPTPQELNAYLARAAEKYRDGVELSINGARLPLRTVASAISTPPGAAGLRTLRVECDWIAELPRLSGAAPRRVTFNNANDPDRLGWREVVVTAAPGTVVFDSSAFGSAVTDELKGYAGDSVAAPLDERTAEFSFATGALPAGAAPLRSRDGRPLAVSRDRLAELISVDRLTVGVALLGLLIACAVGAVHALSPGHGKTVVGAYLIGSRGTPRHALFLGLTVTFTHTAGVFALGLVTLFATQYILPERLFPLLTFVSGAMVLGVGGNMFIRRLASATGIGIPAQAHGPAELAHSTDAGANSADANGADANGADAAAMCHSHGGQAHSHVLPGADGSPVTWRSLLALGISGGILPCPSALVVLLSAFALHRVGYGLLLVLAFSIGLAGALTAIGLLFVCAGRAMKTPARMAPLTRWLPVGSALIIGCIGAGICYEALVQSKVSTLPPGASAPNPGGAVSISYVLLLGLVLGIKHAVEADHLAAVTTLVTQRSSILGSALVGGLWGIGHSLSLLLAGMVVILLHVQIGEKTALALEMGVAVMLIVLGLNALIKMSRGGKLHLHGHRHGPLLHSHLHLHDVAPETEPHTHHGLKLGPRPLIVGMIHGLAGSAALMLLVLTTIPSPLVGFAYIVVFGLGTIAGMMFMSALVGLPVHLTAGRFERAHLALRGLAGIFSLGLGAFMVYQIGFIEGLFY